MPAGVAKPVDGGFRIGGRWKYASGCEHCEWTLLGGTVAGKPDDRRIFVIPNSDYEIVDTWHVPGSRAPAATTSSSRTLSCRNIAPRNTPTISADTGRGWR